MFSRIRDGQVDKLRDWMSELMARDVTVFTEGPSLNYTTALNIAFVVLAAVFVWRFLRTGGPAMLRMMNEHA